MLSMQCNIFHELGQRLGIGVQHSSLPAKIFAHLDFYKSKWAAIHIILKRSTSTLKTKNYFEWALMHITAVLLNLIHALIPISQKGVAMRITSVKIVVATLKIIDKSEPTSSSLQRCSLY